jgi:hypothetical protein
MMIQASVRPLHPLKELGLCAFLVDKFVPGYKLAKVVSLIGEQLMESKKKNKLVTCTTTHKKRAGDWEGGQQALARQHLLVLQLEPLQKPLPSSTPPSSPLSLFSGSFGNLWIVILDPQPLLLPETKASGSGGDSVRLLSFGQLTIPHSVLPNTPHSSSSSFRSSWALQGLQNAFRVGHKLRHTHFGLEYPRQPSPTQNFTLKLLSTTGVHSIIFLR